MKTLKENWKNHEFSRCYLFFGEETYLIREYEAALRKAILPDGADDTVFCVEVNIFIHPILFVT